jgi:transmembrane protein 222
MASSTSPTTPGNGSNSIVLAKIDPQRERYPFCVVWTPIPLLSWILPMVGHMGICDSQGVIHDFAGSYFISEDSMLFGDPVKYWDLSPHIFPRIQELQVLHGYDAQTALRQYDDAVRGTTKYFRAAEQYNFFTNNCHTYVGAVMEAANFQRSRWGMMKIVFYMMFYGRYVSMGRFFKAHLPFLVLCVVAAALGVGVSSAH